MLILAQLQKRQNAAPPLGGGDVKTAAVEWLRHPKVDLKIPFDMIPERFTKLGANVTELLSIHANGNTVGGQKCGHVQAQCHSIPDCSPEGKIPD